jgi:LmbE family N-acetylglucosaminyl deacetylase
MEKELSLLALYAHPDDEQMSTGTLAQLASDGIKTGLVCATRGEAGQLHESVQATQDEIGRIREGELRAAALTVGVKHLWFLDYRDSGWFGSPDNDRADAFANCQDEEALHRIVKIVREFRPTVMVTFDPTGGYGHIDHIKIHQLTMAAFNAAADPGQYPDAGEPWQTSRVYYSIFPASIMEKVYTYLKSTNPDDNFLQIDMPPRPPEQDITTVVDVGRWLETKDRSLRSHRTQRGDYERWSNLPPDILDELRGKEYFMLAAGTPLSEDPEARSDLFAGLR